MAEKGGAGIPVNSWTIWRKLDVSVVRTVVGARRDALVRFLDDLTVVGCWVSGNDGTAEVEVEAGARRLGL